MPEEYPELDSFPAATEYLTNIYLIQRDYGRVSNLQLSRWMHVSNPAVTQAIGRLKKLALVQQKRYGNMELTGKGSAIAISVLKRHYLLEHLLVNILKYPWDKADEEAHVLQNHISASLADHLDTYLGHPQACPHGNPIPGSKHEAELLSAPPLPGVAVGTTISIIRISEEGEAIPAMLPYCEKNGIKPASRFLVEAIGDDCVIMRPVSGGMPALEVPLVLARHIGIRKILPKS